MLENGRENTVGQLSTSSASLNKTLQRLAWLGVIVLYLAVGMIILTFNTIVPIGNQVRLEVGDIPEEDIYAPETRTYESTVFTEQARKEAADGIELQYDRLPSVAREQLDLMREIVDYMALIQEDPYATSEQKLADLESIEALKAIDSGVWEELLNASPFRWKNITDEMVNSLQRVMRLDIFPGENVERTKQNLSVDPDLSDEDQSIVIAVVRELIVANNEFNQTRTDDLKQMAITEVQPRFRTVEQGETIVTKGKRVIALDIEALRQFGLQQTQDSNLRIFLSAFLMLVAVSGAQLFYLIRFYPSVFNSTRMMTVLATMFLGFLAGARAFGPDTFDLPRLYPAAALGLLVTALVGPHLATITVAGLALLVGSMYADSTELVMLITVGGMVGVWGLRDIDRLNSYFTAGLMIGATNILIVTAFMINSDQSPTAVMLITEAFVAVGSGLVAAGVAIVGLFAIGATANLTTSVKLIELMQPNQPLLQLLLRKAPGTYQHSLQVANLAELAAERIEANASLVRVAAMYHDIGKTLNPQFFVENQAGGINPHDELSDPYRSAQLIIGHVVEGERLARRHRLPQRIRDFIREHHGTMMPLYFYYRAIELVDGDESKIDKAAFTYPGPSPQSRETAILLLADGTESTARAVGPRTHEAIEEVVNNIFQRALEDGQLDASNLTLNDLKAIREVFIETLQGIYHQRIDYKKPQLKGDGVPPAQIADTVGVEPSETAKGEASEVIDTLPHADDAIIEQIDVTAAMTDSVGMMPDEAPEKSEIETMEEDKSASQATAESVASAIADERETVPAKPRQRSTSNKTPAPSTEPTDASDASDDDKPPDSKPSEVMYD